MKILLLAGLLLVVGTGCSGAAEPDRPARAFPGAGVDCPAGVPGPVTAELATRALSGAGFSVELDDEACGLEVIAGC